MLTGGFFTLPRHLMFEEVFKKGKFNETYAFVWLISQANFADTAPGENYRDENGQPIQVRRGQLLRSKLQIAQIFGWDRKRLDRYLNKLQDRGFISVNTRPKHFTLITICKYDEYQDMTGGKGARKGTREAPHTTKLTKATNMNESGTPELDYRGENGRVQKAWIEYIGELAKSQWGCSDYPLSEKEIQMLAQKRYLGAYDNLCIAIKKIRNKPQNPIGYLIRIGKDKKQMADIKHEAAKMETPKVVDTALWCP